MPAPVIYVAFVIGTVAAAVAFKEFVYEPHIAPQFEAWNEARRQARRRSQGPEAVPVHQNENDARRAAQAGKRRGSSTPENDPMSVELEDLVAREAAEWRSSPSRPESLLRQRKPHSVIEESNVFIPYDPMAPTQVLFDSSDTESSRSFKSARSPAPRPRSVSPPSAPVIVSPSPRLAASTGSPSSSVFKSQSIPRASPRLPTPVSNASSRGTSPTNSQLYHSASSASSFTPAVIGPYSASSRTTSSIDAMSDAGHDVLSVPGSRITSPFSDVHAVQADRSPSSPFQTVSPIVRSVGSRTLSSTSSPLILSPSISSDFSLPSDNEEGIEGAVLSPSLRSGMFSPSVDLGHHIHDDPFEVGSVHGSETESWDSFGRRTPEI